MNPVSTEPQKEKPEAEMTLSKWKDLFEVAKSIFTILGILAALYWFYQQGEARPRVDISHAISHKKISQEYYWVHVSVAIKNVGKVPANIDSGQIWIQRVTPLRNDFEKNLKSNINIVNKEGLVVIWPNACPKNTLHKLTGSLWIEPGEIDTKSYEYVIPSNLSTVKIYSHFSNSNLSWKFWSKENDTPMGWETITIYDLK